jgi:hypothetical protein
MSNEKSKDDKMGNVGACCSGLTVKMLPSSHDLSIYPRRSSLFSSLPSLVTTTKPDAHGVSLATHCDFHKIRTSSNQPIHVPLLDSLV